MKTLKKGAFATDIHFGRKSNSEQHNQDCIDYLSWFYEQVKKQGDIDYIGFLGDWFETRSAINISTLDFSYEGGKILNSLNIPVYFCVGNHDLYHRHTREIFSTKPFQEFDNFVIINEPTIIKEIHRTALFCPFLFEHEYPDLIQYTNLPFWAGHFEFKGFRVTGNSMLMPTGPDHTLFTGPKHILSGHFHQRQIKDNVVYIGNTYPMDFSDANDIERGLAIYDHSKQDISFINWPDCPKYYKTKLSVLLDNEPDFGAKSRVTCVIDIPITFEEHSGIKNQYITEYNLRDFITEEALEIKEAISDDSYETEEIDGDDIIYDVDELVVKMLNSINTDHINNDILIQEYNRL